MNLFLYLQRWYWSKKILSRKTPWHIFEIYLLEIYLITPWLSGKCPISLLEWYREEVCEWKLKHLGVRAISSSTQGHISFQPDLLWGLMLHLPCHSCQKKYICSKKILDAPHKIMALFRLFDIQNCQRWSSSIFWLWLPAYWKPRLQSPSDHCPPCSISGVKLGGIKHTTDAASAQQSELLTSVPDVLCTLCLQTRSLITLQAYGSFHIPFFN